MPIWGMWIESKPASADVPTGEEGVTEGCICAWTITTPLLRQRDGATDARTRGALLHGLDEQHSPPGARRVRANRLCETMGQIDNDEEVPRGVGVSAGWLSALTGTRRGPGGSGLVPNMPKDAPPCTRPHPPRYRCRQPYRPMLHGTGDSAWSSGLNVVAGRLTLSLGS